MKHSKSADTLLFLLLFTTDQPERNIDKTLFVKKGAQKKVKNSGFWEYFTAISTKS